MKSHTAAQASSSCLSGSVGGPVVQTSNGVRHSGLTFKLLLCVWRRRGTTVVLQLLVVLLIVPFKLVVVCQPEGCGLGLRVG